MPEDDDVRSFYESARAELIARIGHRDNVLIYYVTSVAAVFGFSFAAKDNLMTMLAIPILSAGAAALLAQHHELIGELSKYCRTLEGSFKTTAKQWDTSEEFKTSNRWSQGYRGFGHMFAIAGPSVVALLLTWAPAMTEIEWKWIIAWGVCAIVGTGGGIISVVSFVRRLRND